MLLQIESIYGTKRQLKINQHIKLTVQTVTWINFITQRSPQKLHTLDIVIVWFLSSGKAIGFVKSKNTV